MRSLRALLLMAVAALVGADSAAAFKLHAPPGRIAEGGQVQLWVEREPGDPDHVRLVKVPGTAKAGEDYEDGDTAYYVTTFGTR